MSKKIRLQLIAFLVIAAVGIVYVGGRYVRLPSLFGFGEYTVYLDLPDSGGVFSNAAVTYRGVEVAAEVIDGPASRVWDEAENRLHAQKAVLTFLLRAASGDGA